MENQKLASYHEAAHVVAGWVLDLPVNRVVVDRDGWGVKKSRWFNMTRQFREVSQETVRRDVVFCLSGEYGEMLAGGGGGSVHTNDDFIARFLSRKFALNLPVLREEAFRLVLTHSQTIELIARKLFKKAEQQKANGGETFEVFSPYEMALERMNWLACGGQLSLFEQVSYKEKSCYGNMET